MRLSDFISQVRIANKQVYDGLNTLIAFQREWSARDYGTHLPDGTGVNEGLTHVEVGAVIFDTADAISALLDTGHATNMAKLL